MSILRAYKYEILPSKIGQEFLAQNFGAKRWIFNHYLHENQQRFLNKEQHLSNFDINKDITRLKKEQETTWLKSVDSIALQNAAEDLATAYQNFFDSIKGTRRGPKVSAPLFKNKHSKQSYRTRNIKVDFELGKVFIPKLKWVKCKFDRQFDGKIKSATISKTKTGKYFISILVEEDQKLLPMTGLEVGIDLGLKDLIILDNGTKFKHPDDIQGIVKAKRNLKKQQRKLARKTKGSKAYEVQRIKVAKAYEKVTNIRKDYYHNLSRWLVNSFDSIYLENLNVKGMLRNHKLARKIQEAAWSTLVGMIGYKASWAGKTFHQIGRFVPSSKTCSCCGYKKTDLTLGDRFWDCPSCGERLDRDINAALNIRQFGQIDCYGQVLPSVATTESGAELPPGLQKFANKIERSDCNNSRLAKGATKPKNLLVLR
jgi:putative transposase